MGDAIRSFDVIAREERFMDVERLAEELVEIGFDAQPIGATLLGIRNREDRLPDHSESAQESVRARLSDVKRRAEQIDPTTLERADRVTRSVIIAQAEADIDTIDTRAPEYTITDKFFAPAQNVLTLMPMIGIAEPAHADGYLARLAGLPHLLDTLAERHRAGISAGRVPVQRLVRATVDHLDRYLADPAADPLRRPTPPAGGRVDADKFVAERDRLLTEVVYPGIERYRNTLAADVVTHGRPDDRPGLCWLPDGNEYYTRLARAHTTTDLSPDKLHRMGLDVLERLTAEYAEVGDRVFGTGELSEILRKLRIDPELRWRDGEELLQAARAAVRRAEAAAPRWFSRIPDQQCVVEPVPAAEAPGAAAAYYLIPAMDGSRPGTFYANTYEAEKRDRYASEAVAFHEAVPGHHFQLTISLGLTDLPLLRRIASFTAFAEGWGLYAERLADEMGLYSDDISRLGMLSQDSFRACRLVVDTGLHAMGWTRQQAVDFMVSHTATSEVEIDAEVDRYIAAPGQALAYMVGRLEIQRIRADAERALGDRFDVKGFHDTVLGNGIVPLNVLDEVVRDWVAGQPQT